MNRLTAFARATHPGPTVAVTFAVSLLAAALGRGPAGTALVAVAVLSGQLSIGWANDARDADRDRRAQRSGKPVVAGLVSEPALWRAAVSSAAVCVPMSFVAAGPVGGGAHVLAVAVAWAYNLHVKSTIFSFAPYLVSFGLLAPFLSFGLTPPRAPQPWAVAVFALLGLGAHLANAADDVEIDRQVGAGGLVLRLGQRPARRLAALVLAGASVLLVTHLSLGLPAVLILTAALLALVLAGAAWQSGRWLFPVVLVLGALDAGLLCLNAGAVIG